MSAVQFCRVSSVSEGQDERWWLDDKDLKRIFNQVLERENPLSNIKGVSGGNMKANSQAFEKLNKLLISLWLSSSDDDDDDDDDDDEDYNDDDDDDDAIG